MAVFFAVIEAVMILGLNDLDSGTRLWAAGGQEKGE